MPPRSKPTRQRCKVVEAAAILGLEPVAIRRLATYGRLPSAAKLGGSWTFDIKALQNYVSEQEALVRNRANWTPKPKGPRRYASGPPVRIEKSALEVKLEIEELMQSVLGIGRKKIK